MKKFALKVKEISKDEETILCKDTIEACGAEVTAHRTNYPEYYVIYNAQAKDFKAWEKQYYVTSYYPRSEYVDRLKPEADDVVPIDTET